MSYFIGIEDLAANALIELVEKTGKRTVRFSQLNDYGNAIMATLRKRRYGCHSYFYQRYNRTILSQLF